MPLRYNTSTGTFGLNLQLITNIQMSSRVIKTVAVFIFLIFSRAEASTAQLRTTVHIGLYGTMFGGNSTSDFSPAARFSGGLGLTFEITDVLFIQPEIVYAVKGASVEADIQFEDGADPVPVSARFSLSYFDFPVFLGYQFEGDSFRPRIFAGPYLGYKVNAKVSYQSQEGGPSFTETDDSVVTWDHGVAAGAALHFYFGDEEIAFGVRGSFGLTDVSESTEDQELTSSLRNRTFGLYAGIMF